MDDILMIYSKDKRIRALQKQLIDTDVHREKLERKLESEMEKAEKHNLKIVDKIFKIDPDG